MAEELEQEQMATEIRGAAAARLLGTTARQVQYWIASGQMEGYRDEGGRWVTTYAAVLEHLDHLEAKGRRVAPMRARFIDAARRQAQAQPRKEERMAHAS